MNEIIAELSKPAWWVSVVFFGIVINIISTYLKNYLERKITSSFLWWRKRSEAREKAWNSRIDTLIESTEEMNFAMMSESRQRLRAIYFMLCAILFSVILLSSNASTPAFRITFSFLASFSFFISFIFQNDALDDLSMILEAKKKLTTRSRRDPVSGSACHRSA